MVLPRRPKLTIEQQVEHLKNKGVAFTLCTEEQAASFLAYSTFFFKVKAFDKDYEINPKTGKYLNLDFAYLMELSTLDMHLRRLILHATLDLEHLMRKHTARTKTLSARWSCIRWRLRSSTHSCSSGPLKKSGLFGEMIQSSCWRMSTASITTGSSTSAATALTRRSACMSCGTPL